MGALFSVSHRWEYISPWGEGGGGVAVGWAKQVTYECNPGRSLLKPLIDVAVRGKSSFSEMR